MRRLWFVIRQQDGQNLIISHVEIGGSDFSLSKIEGVFTLLRGPFNAQVGVIKIMSSVPAQPKWVYAVPCSN